MADTVVLQKPLGTDVYNIEVFNSNSTEIEKYLNQALTNIQSINEQLAGGITSNAIPYFNHLGKQLNIDMTDIEFGIYLVEFNLLQGTLPIMIGTNSYALFLNIPVVSGTIYQRLIPFNNDITYQRQFINENWDAWTGVDAVVQHFNEITDQLGYIRPLSAKLGLQLKENKFETFYPTVLDIDNPEQGIYVCDNIPTVSLNGVFPANLISKEHFILINFGGKNGTSEFQLYTDLSYSINNIYIRSRTKEELAWSVWTKVNGGTDGGTGGGNELTVSYPTTINVDTAGSGVYIINDDTMVSGDIPDKTMKNFTLTCYGDNTDSMRSQILMDINNAVHVRVMQKSDEGYTTWSIWKQLNELNQDKIVKVTVVDL